MAANFSDERRSFLKAVMIAGSAAGCVSMAKKSMASEQPRQSLQTESGQGYRETEHIRKYYQTAKN